MRTRDLVRYVEALGWRMARVRGSHATFTHPVFQGVLTFPVNHLGGEISRGLELRVINDARKGPKGIR